MYDDSWKLQLSYIIINRKIIMKILLSLLAVLFAVNTNYAQSIFSADFEDGTLGGMTIVDNDGLVTASGVSLFSDAWTISNSFFENQFDITSTGVISNSRYMPAGTADDWLISPQITIEEIGTAVLWSARALSNNSRDGMEVRVSTTDNSLASFTDIIYSSTGESAEMTQRAASLNDYIGEQIYIAFINNSTDKYLLIVDDIEVKPVNLRDVSITSFATEPYQLKNQDIAIAINVFNNGGNALNSLDLKWSDGTDEYEETITGLNIKTGESAVITSSTSFIAKDDIAYPLEISISNPNGEDDLNISDNTISVDVSGISYIPTKKVVGEEGTGTWCGWCPRGTVAVDSMEAFYAEQFIGIAVHTNDPMEIPAYSEGLGFEAFPNGIVNRISTMEPTEFRDGLAIASVSVSPMSIEVSAIGNESNGTITVEVNTESVTQLVDKDYRLSVIITEDNVKGTSAGYNQTNFYSGLEAGLLVGVDGLDWTTLPNPILASDIVYDHVARAVLGGFEGLAGSIAANHSSGDISTQEFSWTVSSEMVMSKMHAIALLIDNSTGAIINAAKSDVSGITSSTREKIDNSIVDIYPNPVSQLAHIDITLKSPSKVSLLVLNSLGEIVGNDFLGLLPTSTEKMYDVSSLPNGMYIFKINADNVISTKKVMVFN